MAIAGYNKTIKITDIGSPVYFTDTMSNISDNTYSVDNSSNEIWKTSSKPKITDDTGEITSNVKSFDYMFGRVTFDSSFTPSGAVNIEHYKYNSTLLLYGVHEDGITLNTDLLDKTVYDDTGNSRRQLDGLRSSTYTLSKWWRLANTWDSLGTWDDTQEFFYYYNFIDEVILNKREVVIEFEVNTVKFRGFYVVSNIDINDSIEDITDNDIEFESTRNNKGISILFN